jgi:hypothetical protein
MAGMKYLIEVSVVDWGLMRQRHRPRDFAAPVSGRCFRTSDTSYSAGMAS